MNIVIGHSCIHCRKGKAYQPICDVWWCCIRCGKYVIRQTAEITPHDVAAPKRPKPKISLVDGEILIPVIGKNCPTCAETVYQKQTTDSWLQCLKCGEFVPRKDAELNSQNVAPEKNSPETEKEQMSDEMRIALVPYKVGQEPEGMVKGVSADSLSRIASGICTARDFDTQDAIAAAVKACQRNAWEEWVKTLSTETERVLAESMRKVRMMAWASHDDEVIKEIDDVFRSYFAPVESEDFWQSVERISDQQRKMPRELRDMAGVAKQEFHTERLPRNSARKEKTDAEFMYQLANRPSWATHRKRCLRIAKVLEGVGGPVRNLVPRLRDALSDLDAVRLKSDQLAREGDQFEKHTHLKLNQFLADVRDNVQTLLNRATATEEPIEDVPELWVSRDEGGSADYCSIKPVWKPRRDGNGSYWAISDPDFPLRPIPDALADVLNLQPGHCRLVTSDEYQRFFEPVLDLPANKRYSKLEALCGQKGDEEGESEE